MAAALCPAPDPAAGLVAGLSFTVDCNVQGASQAVYGALAQPGSAVSSALFGLLTLYVAFIGYRLLLGRSPLRVGELTVSALKIGLVVLLATSWGAYQTVVYDVLTHGPGAVAGSLMSSLQPDRSVFRGDPYQGLQLAFDQLQLSAAAFSQRAGQNPATFQGGLGFSAFGLNTAGYLMLLTTLGSSLAARIGLALLLGLAPLFAAFLLFAPTRGLIEGWLRSSIALALVPMTAALALAMQLVMLEPSLIALAAAREEGRLDTAAASSVLVLCLIYAGVVGALLMAAAAVGFGLRLPRLRPAAGAAEAAAASATASRETRAFAAASEPLPRAAAVAAAAMAAERRDQRGLASATAASVERRISTVEHRRDEPAPAGAAPGLGMSFRRRAEPRRSAVAARRDR